jgi:hypothetical protein
MDAKGVARESKHSDAPKQEANLSSDPAALLPSELQTLEFKIADPVSVQGQGYSQTICALKSKTGRRDGPRQTLFRFGNWMYTGDVDLGPPSTLARASQTIDSIQRQQYNMTYECEAASMPSDSCFAPALQQMDQLLPLIEAQIVGATWWLENIAEQIQTGVLQKQMFQWLVPDGDDGDEENLFFQIDTIGGTRSLSDIMAGKGGSKLDDVELLAHKLFNRGLLLLVVYFGGSFFVSVRDAEGAEQSLMDTRFPDFAARGQGCQIKNYANGLKDWPMLRKLEIWQLLPAVAGQVRQEVQLPIGPAEPKSSGEKGEREGKLLKEKGTAPQTIEESYRAAGKSQPQPHVHAKEVGGSTQPHAHAKEVGESTRSALPKSLAPLASAPHTRMAPLAGGNFRRPLPWDRNGAPLRLK